LVNVGFILHGSSCTICRTYGEGGSIKIRKAEDIGAIARQRRLDLNLSQVEVARLAGVTRQWLIRFEQGNPQATLVNVVAVLGRLDLDIRIDPASRAASSDAAFQVPRISSPDTSRRPDSEVPTFSLNNPETFAGFQRQIREQEESFRLAADE
jgi:transcriptional regulator with XRE-family HTH domain